MIGRKFNFHDGEIGAALAVRVKTGSKQNKIDRVLKDGTVVLTIINNPPDLNNEVIAYLAMQLGIEKKRFDIIAGEGDRDKIISILNIEPEHLQDLILDKIS
jgi:uncharacterized protein YggU (UPF0235/DUF167 family)